MPAPRKYDKETQERAIRMYRDRLRENPGESKLAARKHVSRLLRPSAYPPRGMRRRQPASRSRSVRGLRRRSRCCVPIRGSRWRFRWMCLGGLSSSCCGAAADASGGCDVRRKGRGELVGVRVVQVDLVSDAIPRERHRPVRWATVKVVFELSDHSSSHMTIVVVRAPAGPKGPSALSRPACRSSRTPARAGPGSLGPGGGLKLPDPLRVRVGGLRSAGKPLGKVALRCRSRVTGCWGRVGNGLT
jgi:hypothetical protein